MKKILLAIIFALCIPGFAHAALTDDTLWEVRTTGNNDNGGCFDVGASGTDYTGQDAAQLTLTDLATSGIGVTTLTSATGGFTAAMIGNCIQIKSGTNVVAGFYQITAHTDTNTVTLDRAPDDGVGGISGGTGSVGGGLLTIQKAADNVAAGHTVWIKDGDGTNYNETVTLATSGTSQLPIYWWGYDTSRNDRPTGVERPIIDGQDTRASCWSFNSKNNNIVGFIRFTAATGNCVGGASSGHALYRVRIDNCGAAGVGVTSARIFGSEIDNNVTDGINLGTSNPLVFYNYIHDNSNDGGVSRAANLVGNVIVKNTDYGYSMSRGAAYVVNNTFWNNGAATDDCFLTSQTTYNTTGFFINNIMEDCADYGFDHTLGSGNWVTDYNDCTGAGTGCYDDITAGPNDTTHGAAFVSEIANSEDFGLKSTSALRGIGFPGSPIGEHTNGGGTSYMDVGAIQAQLGGGGTTAFTFVGN